ncbi:MAG: type II secretion system protein [Elusimicrobiota bacterium]|nr:type II secretion system protein [Elusimicrobiota bacterium]
MRNAKRGTTLTELMLAVAVLGVVSSGVFGLLKYTGVAVNRAQTTVQAQEETRQALALIEDALIHANEVRVASATYAQFILDIEHAPGYDPNADGDGDGVPSFRDGDRDSDVQLLLPAATQWQAGYNLKDDDEDGDGQIDMEGRLYLSGRSLLYETRVNGGAWGGRRPLLNEVSTFTLTYWGNRANPLGAQIDLGANGTAVNDAGQNDGVISSVEMDAVLAPAGMGNRNGALDLANERRYITSIRVALAVDRDKDGKNDYALEMDLYPPLLPLKSR